MTSVSVMKGDNCFTVWLQSQSLQIETAVFTSHRGRFPKRKTLITTERRVLAELDRHKILHAQGNDTLHDISLRLVIQKITDIASTSK